MHSTAHRRARSGARFAGVAAAAATLAVGALAGTAHAAAPAARPALPAFTGLTDPAGDAGDGRVDITAAAASWVGGTIRLYARVAQPTDPATWTGRTRVAWALDTNGDGTQPFWAELTAGTVGAVYRDSGDPVTVAHVPAHYLAGLGVYELDVPARALGYPKQVSFVAYSSLEAVPNLSTAGDYAPDQFGESAPIAPLSLR